MEQVVSALTVGEIRGFAELATHPWITAVCEAVLGPEYRIVELGFDVPGPGAMNQPGHRDFPVPETPRRSRVRCSFSGPTLLVPSTPDGMISRSRGISGTPSRTRYARSASPDSLLRWQLAPVLELRDEEITGMRPRHTEGINWPRWTVRSPGGSPVNARPSRTIIDSRTVRLKARGGVTHSSWTGEGRSFAVDRFVDRAIGLSTPSVKCARRRLRPRIVPHRCARSVRRR